MGGKAVSCSEPRAEVEDDAEVLVVLPVALLTFIGLRLNLVSMGCPVGRGDARTSSFEPNAMVGAGRGDGMGVTAYDEGVRVYGEGECGVDDVDELETVIQASLSS